MKHLITVLVVVLGAGCGTVLSGTSQPVSIVGVAQDARVTVDGRDVGAERQVRLSRGSTHTVTAERPGCRAGAATVTRNFNGVAVLNLVNPLGWIIDAMTGGMWDLDETVAVPQDCATAALAPAR